MTQAFPHRHTGASPKKYTYTLADLCALGHCSRSTVYRDMKRRLNPKDLMSVARWLVKRAGKTASGVRK